MPRLTCNNQCPKCCVETVEEIKARSEATLAARAMTLSNVATVAIIGAHIYFQGLGQELKLPAEIYAIILGPYGGAAIAKIADKLTNKGGK